MSVAQNVTRVPSRMKECAYCHQRWPRALKRPSPKGFCSATCKEAYYTDPERIAQHFWSHVMLCRHGQGCATCCWVWTGAQTRGGYGNCAMYQDGTVRHMRANRMSWLLEHGTIPVGLNVLHNCPGGDNRLCVNPAHLWLGTHKENTQDALQKGRLATGTRHGLHRHPDRIARGEHAGQARLSAEQVLDIRYLAAHGMTQRLLGAIYDVHPGAIGQITRGKNWKHLPLIVEER